MLKNQIQPFTGSSCLVFYEHHQNSVLRFHVPFEEKCSDDAVSFLEPIVQFCNELGENIYYKENILYYISGFIVRKVNSFLKCNEYVKPLCNDSQSKHTYNHFTSLISRGYRVKSSNGVFILVKYL